MKRIRCALLLSLCLLQTACGRAAGTAVQAAAEPSAPPPAPAAATPAPYEEVPVYYNGLLSDRGYRQGGVIWVSPAALAALFDLDFSQELQAETYTLNISGVDMRGQAGQDYALAESRCLYTPGGFLTVDGQVYLPAEAAAHLFGLGVTVDPEAPAVELDVSRVELLHGSGDYYAMHYPVEDLYWLSHIIQAEAGQQPLAGQIGVGNVVLNRVKSPDFPDSIREVVTQRNDTIAQFDPVASGSIHNPVDDPAMLAACLCLEGYNTVGESLYFLNPTLADNSWFESARDFAVSIGDHDFYT